MNRKELLVACKSSGKQSESTPKSSIWQPLVFAEKIREVSKSCRSVFLQRGTPHGSCSPPLLLGRTSAMDISCQSSAKQLESTPGSRICQHLVFADMMREVSKSCRNLVLQRWDHMAHVVPPLQNEVLAALQNFSDLVSQDQRLPNLAVWR